MKIAMLTTWFPPIIGGSGNRFYEIGRRLSKKYEVHIYTAHVEGCNREEERDGMVIHRYGKFDIPKSKSIEGDYHISKLKFSCKVLWEGLKMRDFDIVDCNVVSKPLSYVSYFISRSSDTPLILTWHEVWYEKNFESLNPFLALPGFFLELFIPKLSDINIAVSATTKRRLIELLGVDPGKIVEIPNGVDLKEFEMSVEKKYGRILYAGRLERHKKVDNLILAYKRLKRIFPEIELIIVGSGPQKVFLQKLAKELHIDVKFYEPLPRRKLIELMKSSWIFVLPSIREGQGIVLLEAMAAGTPPIAVKAEGSAVGDIVKNNCNGILISQSEMENAIKRLLMNEDLHTSLRENGLKFVRNYNWDEIAKRVAKLYERIVRGC